MRNVGNYNATSSSVKEFIIFGFPSLNSVQTLLFGIFFPIYLFTITGNTVILLLIWLDRHLQTPMYFFVSNLSILDISYISVTVPKMLAKFLLNSSTISYSGCFVQMYFFLSLVATECFLLMVMAYDRYLAICTPLHYPMYMTKKLCFCLCTTAWIGGFMLPFSTFILALKLPFCGPNVIHHYYCDHPPLIQLACADTSVNVAVGSSVSFFVFVVTFSLIVASYIKIIVSILKISSTTGRRKTFSTCASHFLVVNLFFLPLAFMYIRPTASYSSDVDSLVAMVYSMVTPMLNPIIYSLRNQEFKGAFWRQMKRNKAFST
ncbi:olfactory receptor 6N1-like [Rhinatrema bivittatum]|uniref:olfactory receptor 6N1-like n=1 Tax=Rhinatrema bivittatum TaxID=194408 RepID=UPI00112BB926|nr:olfactory receptor 6N1-like [Rhinatrema bivittatum]